MSLYWLQPGWTSARCSCGTNIWKSGGDPDWGECYDCFSDRLAEQEHYRELERQHGEYLAQQYQEHLEQEAAHERD